VSLGRVGEEPSLATSLLFYRKATMNNSLNNVQNIAAAYRFFRENAWPNEGESAKGSLQLARAEQWAKESGIRFVWGKDAFWKSGDVDLCSAARDCPLSGGVEVLASEAAFLDFEGGDTSYKRVIEAMAAHLAMPDSSVKYNSLADLKAAYACGKLQEKFCVLTIDNDESFAYDYSKSKEGVKVYSGPGRNQMYAEALSLLDIPWEEC
jgi:hypothetical protein